MLHTVIGLLLIFAIYCGWQSMRLPESAEKPIDEKNVLYPLPGDRSIYPPVILRALHTIRGPTFRFRRARPGESRRWEAADTLKLPP